MVKGTVKLTQSGTGMESVKKAIEALSRKEVLVGIPEDNASRDGEINNAELLYIHSHGVRNKKMRDEMQSNIDNGIKYSKAHSLYVQTHGSPLLNVPARPVLEPAIEDSKEVIASQIKKASKSALDGNSAEAEANLNKAGMIAQSVAQNWFENPKNNWPPNSPKTIAKKGSNIPLVDTNEMRKSITYVLRDK